MRFLTDLLSREGGTVRYIKAVENGRPAWYFIKLSPMEYAQYKKALRTGSLDLKEFGEIILSGWGEEAPEDVKKDMQKRYDVK